MATDDGPGSRHHRTRQALAPWTCPNCREEQYGKLEDGCMGCGAGTAASNEAAAREAERLEAERIARESVAVTLGRVGETLIAVERPITTPVPFDAYVLEGKREVPQQHELSERVALEGYTTTARLTIARALSTYAENDLTEPDDLPKAITIAWAKQLLGL